jgi:hypothetical protein
MGYVLVYFLRGTLPWQGMRAKAKEAKYELIKQKKLGTTPDKLCRGFPCKHHACSFFLKK